jgi:hypothetical protein
MLGLSPGSALGGPGEEVWTTQNNSLLYITTHRTPESQNLNDMVERLVRSLCQISACGVAWVSLSDVWWEVVDARGSRSHEGGFAKKSSGEESAHIPACTGTALHCTHY